MNIDFLIDETLRGFTFLHENLVLLYFVILLVEIEVALNSNARVKSNRTVLSVEEKVNVRDIAWKKISKAKIMTKYNIEKYTVNDILKIMENLENFK